MCNRFVQNGRMVRPGERCVVLMRGPGGTFEMEFDGAVFGGAARADNSGYWTGRAGAEEVRVPAVSRYGEKNKATGAQSWEDVAAGAAMQGLLLPMPPGKDYRLLKVVTTDGGPRRAALFGNDRTPVFEPALPETPGKISVDGGAGGEGPVAQGELF